MVFMLPDILRIEIPTYWFYRFVGGYHENDYYFTHFTILALQSRKQAFFDP